MGAKGRRRREKNYRAAHGGDIRLPPPPDASSIEALPSKLRKIMSFSGPEKGSLSNTGRNREDGGRVVEKKLGSEKRSDSKEEVNGQDLITQHTDYDDGVSQNILHDKKKKKRKRNKADDLRFEALDGAGAGSKRKERRKQRSEERKKKQKRAKLEEDVNFPGREEITFGDIVQAPPKLVVLPKASKTIQGASQERVRLQAIDAYRKRKGWTSRPGVQLPSPVLMAPSL